MTKTYMFLLAIIFLFIICMYDTTIPDDEERGFSIPRGFEDVVVVIEDAERVKGTIKYSVHGTGFLLFDERNSGRFLITNRHILQNRDSIFVRFNTAGGKSHRLKAHLVNKVGVPLWKGHPDTTIDIAVMHAPKGLSLVVFGVEMIKKLSDINLGDEVYYLGFPLREFAGKDKNYPVYRRGIVSYISKEDIPYIDNPAMIILQKDMILIDATSLPGNSGSPVLSPPISESHGTSLIGVIQGHIEDTQYILTSSGDSVKVRENINLGIVIPAERILEAIANLSSK